MEREEEPTTERAAEILESRAAALARPAAEEDEKDHLELMVIRCGTASYGLETRWVHEVQPAARLTPVPGAPSEWAGLMNLRGVIYPLLDGARYLRLPEHASVGSQVVLLSSPRDTIGFLVAEIAGMDRVAADEIGPALEENPGRPGVILGVTSGMLPIIDAEMILTDPLVTNNIREESA